MSIRPIKQFFLAFVVTTLALVAQSVTGNISGTVTDSTNSPLSGATVTVTNADQGTVAWTGKTNDSGIYRAPSLPVGRYNVAFEAPGFKKRQISQVNLSVDQRADISASLELGAVTETVTVSGSAEGQLATDTASVGGTITPSQVQALPLPNRNILNLLTLTPGVSSGGAATNLNSAQLSINGSRTLNSEFTIDGVSVVTGSTGSPQTLPPADAIREFRVLASSYSSEYGRTSGGIISLITNSGTSQYHGAAYEYFRNEDLNANDFFRNLRGQPRAQDRYNLFGAKFGGPLSIPKLYHGKDRTFFFINYEGLRQAVPFANISTVPSAAMRTGDLSASPVRVYQPGTTTPFPGNRIPGNLIDPASAKILSLLPQPNSGGAPNAADNIATNNYVSSGSTHPSNNTGVLRIDHSVSERIRLFGTFTHYNNLSPSGPIFPGILDNAAGDSATTGYQSVLGYTQNWTPTLITEVRFGFFRNNNQYRPPTLGINVANALGIQRSTNFAVPVFNITGFSQMGTNANTYRQQIDNNYQTSGSATKSAGNHLIKFGVDLRKNQFNDFNPTQDAYGVYNFTGEITSPTRTGGDPVNALADFLLGSIKTSNYSLVQPIIGRRNYNLGLFLQDDWKVLPRLTVNLGVRYEYESPITTANNMYSRVDPTTGNVLFAGKNASSSLNLNGAKFNFGPRVGIAYSATPKTVIRSGFGIFYSQLFSDLGGQVLFPGYTVTQSFSNLGTGVAQPFTLAQGMPLVATLNLQDPASNIARYNSPSNFLSFSGYAAFAQTNPLPYAAEWNFGVQQQILAGTILEVNYVGSHGVHLPINLPYNTVPYQDATSVASANTSLTTQLARPFPTVGSFNSISMAGTSSYNALQVGVNRQYSSNLAFTANYTWSRSIDDSSGIYSFSQPSGLNAGQFPNTFRYLDRGLSEFDRPHSFTGSIIYHTTGNKWLRNFEISPILTARSGIPIYISQNNLNPAATQLRPDLVNPQADIYAHYAPSGTAVRYLLPTSSPNFPLAPVGPLFTGSGSSRRLVLPASIGTLGRNVYRGPGELNLDLSVGRQFPLTERFKLDIRAEAFNVLNHTNFQSPSASANQLTVTASSTGQPIFNSPNFGQITSANPSRFLQLVARFEF